MVVKPLSYAYYGSSDANGNLNDLQSASQQLPDGMGGWNTVGVEYYRYWLGTELTGIIHGLKMHFGPEAYRLIFNAGIDLESAADSAVLPYADHYYEYNTATGAVTKEIAAVCPGCPGGGTTSDLFAYTPGPGGSTGYNVWAMKTVQTLPDSSQIIVYTNYAGLPMLQVQIDRAINKFGRGIPVPIKFRTSVLKSVRVDFARQRRFKLRVVAELVMRGCVGGYAASR